MTFTIMEKKHVILREYVTESVIRRPTIKIIILFFVIRIHPD